MNEIIYNIKGVDDIDKNVKFIHAEFGSLFFLMLKVYRLRLLGDYHHSTRIAFVEFVLVRYLSTLRPAFDLHLFFHFLNLISL